MRCRKNVKDLSDTEKRDFVRAIKGLKAQPSVLHPGMQSRYDDYVEIHRSAMDAAIVTAGQVLNPGWGHFDSAFFPWHRELLFRFENELRAQVPGVTIPYWDWTRGQAPASPAWPFTHTFIGVDGTDAVQDRVERQAGAPSPYPYEFDPDTWTIVVKDAPAELGFFRRAFAERADAPSLPSNDTVVTGTGSSFRTAIASASYLNLRARSEDIHNLVHRWVGGNMLTGSSPNDPVFWMHHAAIDRMWTLWQEKHPATAPYVHTNGFAGHGLTDTLIFHEPGDPAPWVGTATPAQLLDAHAMHGTSVWYASDLPEITPQGGGTIAFGSVPEGMTQYRAAHFQIKTCRQVRFRVTGPPTGNFSLPLGAQSIVEPDLAAEMVDGYVWVGFLANGASPQFSTITVEAFILDDEGYYAATEGGEFSLGTFTFNLSASVTPRDDNSVVLVLDRSGSMGAPAGGGSTRSQLLKSAVSTFHALLRPTDEIGVVSFDDVTDNLLPLTTQAAGLGTTLTGSGLDPRGMTAIGLGIQAGAGMLAGASHTNRSLLVLTDGNQNVHPYIAELPAGTVTSRTYAIGFGLPGQVSDAALHDITQNTHGDLIITGLLGSQQESYLLTKAFVQTLAGITSANVVLDPQAELLLGSKHSVPFQVTEADVSIDVILLAPVAVMADVVLVTPDGTTIDAGTAAGEPNIEFSTHPEVSFYRIDLPALPLDPGGTHAGTWQIQTRIRDEAELKKLLRNEDLRIDRQAIRQIVARGALPYTCVVHARSNLDFAATVTQTATTPGARATITASLNEYGIPFAGTATVWAELTAPDGAASTLSLAPVGPGSYQTTMTADQPGIYQLRVRAEGATSYGSAFTREKTLTIGTSARIGGSGDGLEPIIEELREHDRALCELLDCVSEHALERARDQLARLGLEPDELRACIRRACAHLDRAQTEPGPGGLPAQPEGRPVAFEPFGELGLLASQAIAMLENEIVPKIAWPDSAARALQAARFAEIREKMSAEHDPGLMMFPRIIGDCPPDCEDEAHDHVHAPEDADGHDHVHPPGDAESGHAHDGHDHQHADTPPATKKKPVAKKKPAAKKPARKRPPRA